MMIADPLSALRLLTPVFTACKAIFDTWKLTKSFGREFFKAECMLDAQFVRLMQIGTRRLDQLAEPIDPNDESDPTTRVIHGLLLNVQTIFNQCGELIFEYKRQRVRLQKRPHQFPNTTGLVPISSATITPVSPSEATPSISSAPSGSTLLTVPHTPPSSVSGTSTPTTSGEQRQPKESKKDRKSRLHIKSIKTWVQKKEKQPTMNPPGRVQAPAVRQELRSPMVSSNNEMLSSLPLLPLLPLSTAPGPSPPRSQLQDESQALQDNVEAEKKLKWAITDMKKLHTYIDDVTKQVDALDNLTRLRPGRGLAPSVSGSADEDAHLKATARKTQQVLERLHLSLRAMNRLDKYGVSLQLSNDFEESGMLFAKNHDYLGLDYHNSSSFYLALQRYTVSKDADGSDRSTPRTRHTSSLIVAETSLNTCGQPPDATSHQANDLDQAEVFRQDESAETFIRWGAVFTQPMRNRMPDAHWLFRDQVHSWTSNGTLADALAEGTPARRMTVTQRIQLALMIANSYLYLATTRTTCQPITLQKFRYYTLHDDENSWDPCDPLLLRPYLDFGFGQRLQDVVIGGRSLRSSLSPIIDLGISLVQVGCCALHEYDARNTRSMTDARSWAQRNFKVLDSYLPVQFTEVAQDCVLFESRDLPGQHRENVEQENEFLLDKVGRLREMERKFNAATRAGSRIPRLGSKED